MAVLDGWNVVIVDEKAFDSAVKVRRVVAVFDAQIVDFVVISVFEIQEPHNFLHLIK